MKNIEIRETREIGQDDILNLYQANNWSSSKKPDLLYNALLNSHSLVSAWDADRLVGLGNAISDGFLVVYYPHLLVHPDYHKMGVGKKIMNKMEEIYGLFHMQILVADANAVKFYQKVGFSNAGQTTPMWIYSGKEH